MALNLCTPCKHHIDNNIDCFQCSGEFSHAPFQSVNPLVLPGNNHCSDFCYHILVWLKPIFIILILLISPEHSYTWPYFMLQGSFGNVNSLLIWKYITVLKCSKLLRSCWIGWQTVLHTVSESRSLVCDEVIFFEFPEHKFFF